MVGVRVIVWSSMVIGGALFVWTATGTWIYGLEAERHTQQLERDAAKFLRSAADRRQITEQVLSRHMSLAEAAYAFCAAGAGNRPKFLQEVLNSFPGFTDDERAAAWVIQSVKMAVGDQPTSEQTELIDFLEDELDAWTAPSAVRGDF